MLSEASLRNRVALLVAALIAAGVAGCAINDPYASHTATTKRGPAAPSDSGDPAAERGGTIPRAAGTAEDRLAAGAGQSTPQAALVRYAELYVNWSAGDVFARQQQLASMSLGQARAEALQAAASVQRDDLLTRSQVANAGQVVAIAPGEGAAMGEWVVVTREQTTGQGDYAGLPTTLHVIYARLVQTRQGWVVSSWSPQN